VSETARGLERLLEGLLRRGAPPGDEEAREIATFLARLREIA
jgi:hypothetical protein